MRRLVGALSAVLAIGGMSVLFAPAASAEQCGFYKEGRIGYYKHCGDSFILVKVHWDTGDTFTTCESPWYTDTFYPDGSHEVVNAYYVTTPPDVADLGDGHRACRSSQPQV